MEKIDRKEQDGVFNPVVDKGATVYIIGCEKQIPLRKIEDFFETECGAKKITICSYGNALVEKLQEED